MHKEIYKDLIKIFILLLCTSNRQDKEIAITDYKYMYIHNNVHDQLNCNFYYSFQLYILFDILVILIILFLQCVLLLSYIHVVNYILCII